jgi:hypothetical protein
MGIPAGAQKLVDSVTPSLRPCRRELSSPPWWPALGPCPVRARAIGAGPEAHLAPAACRPLTPDTLHVPAGAAGRVGHRARDDLRGCASARPRWRCGSGRCCMESIRLFDVYADDPAACRGPASRWALTPCGSGRGPTRSPSRRPALPGRGTARRAGQPAAALGDRAAGLDSRRSPCQASRRDPVGRTTRPALRAELAAYVLRAASRRASRTSSRPASQWSGNTTANWRRTARNPGRRRVGAGDCSIPRSTALVPFV